MVTQQQIDSDTASAHERLQKCATRAREKDQLANEANAEASRLRKEMKRARKSYKQARQDAKEAAKKAKKANGELSECLTQAIRDLAIALQKGKTTEAKTLADESLAAIALRSAQSLSAGETHQPLSAAG
jgi:hypothetical protein